MSACVPFHRLRHYRLHVHARGHAHPRHQATQDQQQRKTPYCYTLIHTVNLPPYAEPGDIPTTLSFSPGFRITRIPCFGVNVFSQPITLSPSSSSVDSIQISMWCCFLFQFVTVSLACTCIAFAYIYIYMYRERKHTTCRACILNPYISLNIRQIDNLAFIKFTRRTCSR